MAGPVWVKGQDGVVGEHPSSYSGPAVLWNSMVGTFELCDWWCPVTFPCVPSSTTASCPWSLPLCCSPLLSSDTQETASQALVGCRGVPGPLRVDIPWGLAREDSTRFCSHSFGFVDTLPGPGTNQQVFNPILKYTHCLPCLHGALSRAVHRKH